jgi:hypothetical protein
MAYAVLPQETAKALTVSLISDVPALQAAIAIQASKKRDRDVEGFRTSVENN